MKKIFLQDTYVIEGKNGVQYEKRGPGFFRISPRLDASGKEIAGGLTIEMAKELIKAGRAKPATENNEVIPDHEPPLMSVGFSVEPKTEDTGLISDEENDDG